VIMILGLLIPAALGWLRPEIAAVLNTVVAALVIFNSARLVRFGEELHTAEPKAAPTIRDRVEAVEPASVN
jgi:hypothetical protein